MSARVIKAQKILGVDRVYGDIISDEELSKIPARSLDALIGSHAIDMNGTESNLGQSVGFSGSNQNVARLQASVDRLTEIIEALVGQKLSEIDVKSLASRSDEAVTLEGTVEDIIPEEVIEVESQKVEVKPTSNTRSKPKAKAKAKTRAKTKPKPKASPKSEVVYKKGDKVSFVGGDNEILKGSIITVVKSRKVVNVKVGDDVWEVRFADLK